MFGSVLLFFSCFSNKLYSNRALSVLNSTKTFSKKLEDYGAYVFFSYGGGYNDTIFKDNIIHLCCVQHNYTVIHVIGFNICIFSIN